MKVNYFAPSWYSDSFRSIFLNACLKMRTYVIFIAHGSKYFQVYKYVFFDL